MKNIKKAVHKLLLLTIIFSCNNQDLYKEDFDYEEIPGTSVYNFKSEQMQGDKKKWDLNSTEAQYFNDKNQVHLVDMKMNFYDSDQTITSWVVADKGIINNANPNNTRVQLISNVVIQSSNNTTLKGPRFLYEEKKELLTSKDRVQVTYPDGTIVKGTGFRANNKIEQIVFESDVEGIIPDDE